MTEYLNTLVKELDYAYVGQLHKAIWSALVNEILRTIRAIPAPRQEPRPGSPREGRLR